MISTQGSNHLDKWTPNYIGQRGTMKFTQEIRLCLLVPNYRLLLAKEKPGPCARKSAVGQACATADWTGTPQEQALHSLAAGPARDIPLL